MALATAPEDRGSTFPNWCGVKLAPGQARGAARPDRGARRACAAGAVSAALRAAFSMRGIVVTPFNFIRRAISFITFPGREFLIGISGYTTTLSCPFRGNQRSFSANTGISVNFPQRRAHFVTHGRGHGY
jgi:hypothetical protein